MIGAANKTSRIAFYVTPQLSLMAFTSAIEPLRMANQLSDKPLYEWTVVSADGNPVRASCGIEIAAAHGTDTTEQYDAVFVCAGLNVHLQQEEAGIAWLRKLATSGTTLGAVCTGTYRATDLGAIHV